MSVEQVLNLIPGYLISPPNGYGVQNSQFFSARFLLNKRHNSLIFCNYYMHNVSV